MGEYRFELADPAVTVDGDRAGVTATVTFHRTEGAETYRWEFRLREDGEDGWRLWTITEP